MDCSHVKKIRRNKEEPPLPCGLHVSTISIGMSSAPDELKTHF